MDKQMYLYIGTLRFIQFVVMLDLTRYRFITVNCCQLNIRGVGHVKIA